MTVIKNWVKGALLAVAVPCIFTTAVVVGAGFHLLGIKVTKGKKSPDEQDTIH